jgi:hypothetical protein
MPVSSGERSVAPNPPGNNGTRHASIRPCPHPGDEQRQHPADQEPYQVDEQDRQGLARLDRLPMATATPTLDAAGMVVIDTSTPTTAPAARAAIGKPSARPGTTARPARGPG